MAVKELSRVDGPRNMVHILREVATLQERNPKIGGPIIRFNSYESDGVRWSVSFYSSDWSLSDEERKEQQRLGIEGKFNAIIDGLDDLVGPLEWTANDPSDPDDTLAKNYFILTALYRGCEFSIMTSRENVGEEVAVIESGPQVIEGADGYVQTVRQQATIWRPNIQLGRRASAKAWELESKPVALAVEA